MRKAEKQMSQGSGLMKGKRGVILGVANNRSIAWGIAKACHDAGAEIALTWQGDALKKRVEPLAREIGGILLGHCDVTDPATIDAVFAELGKDGVDRGGVGDVAMAQQDTADLPGQRLDPLLQRIALPGQRDLGAGVVACLGDAPRNRAVIGNAEDHSPLALHQA